MPLSQAELALNAMQKYHWLTNFQPQIQTLIREEMTHMEQEKVFVRRINQKSEKLQETKVVLGAFIAFGRFGFPTIYIILCSIFAVYGVAAN